MKQLSVIFISIFILVLAACSGMKTPNTFCPSVSPYKSVQPFVVISTANRDSMIDERKGNTYTHVTKDMLMPDTLPYKYKYFIQQVNVKHPFTISLWCDYELSDTISLVMCKTCTGTINCMVGKNNLFTSSYCIWE
jgi:hypothetical protein